MESCKTRPPPGQDINEYLARLNDILQQLSSSNNKSRSIERIDLMIENVKEVVLKINPNATF
jgi:hypothetical protein